MDELHARRRRRVWLTATIVPLVTIVAFVLWATGFWRDRRSADERLAEIEAARAIPDSENASMVYNELLKDPNASSILTLCPPFLEPPIFNQVRDEAWLTKDHPELAAWMKEHQYIIDRLLGAAKFEKCRFPLSIDIDDMGPMRRAAPMRQWGYLMTFAANNDIAEGRIDAAMTKWQCLFRMGDHLAQQPLHTDRLCANGV